MKYFLGLILLMTLVACKEDYGLKPVGHIRLEYPQPVYKQFISDCNYTFEFSNQSNEIQKGENCWYVLHYPEMKANIYLTYFTINGKEDLATKIKDSERVVHEQTVKASYISPREFIFDNKK